MCYKGDLFLGIVDIGMGLGGIVTKNKNYPMNSNSNYKSKIEHNLDQLKQFKVD